MVDYGKMAKEALAEEKRIFTSPSMKKVRELPFGYTNWQYYNNLSKELLEQANFKEYKKSEITKVYNYTTKLIDDYEKESQEKCAMLLAESDSARNIPKEWITAKVWAVLLKNPVYKDYVKKNASFVNKKLQKTPLTKEIDYSIFEL